MSGAAVFNTDYAQTGAAAFTSTSGTLTFAAGSSTAQVTVLPMADLVAEPNETVVLTVASGAGYMPSLPNTATGTIANDDVAGFLISPASGLVTTEEGGTATFTVRLTSQPLYSVTMILSSSDATEGTISPDLIGFTPTTWDTEQTVTLTGVADGIVDGNVAYSIIAQPVDSLGTDYMGLDPPDITVTNRDSVSLDADGNGTADALSDGILILRYLFDPTGAWNVERRPGQRSDADHPRGDQELPRRREELRAGRRRQRHGRRPVRRHPHPPLPLRPQRRVERQRCPGQRSHSNHPRDNQGLPRPVQSRACRPPRPSQGLPWRTV